MKKPEFITFTGIDDRTDLVRASILDEQYPIEWGILFSGSNRDARYPSKQTVDEIVSSFGFGKLSAHLCGKASKKFQDYTVDDANFLRAFSLSNFDRIQVNGNIHDDTKFYDHEQRFLSAVITQSRGPFDLESKTYQLYDESGGKGEIPSDDIPLHPGNDRFVGFAGGIGPDTVMHYLKRIQLKNEDEFWIDMESNVRTGGWFDLDKVQKVCELVYGRKGNYCEKNNGSVN